MYIHVNKQSELSLKFDLLANVEPTESNFLTCYLDIGRGRRQALSVFRRLKKNLKNKLDARQIVDFEHAVKMVEDHLSVMASKSHSIMIFCRSILGGQFFQAIPMSQKLGNRLFFQPKPKIDGVIGSRDFSDLLHLGQSELEILKHSSDSLKDSNTKYFSIDRADYAQSGKHSGGSFDLVA